MVIESLFKPITQALEVHKMHVCMISGGFDPLLPTPIGPIESYVYGLSKILSNKYYVNVLGYGNDHIKENNNEITAILANSKIMPFFRATTSFCDGHYGHAIGFNLNILLRLFSLQFRKKIDLVHFNVIYSAPIASIFKSLYGVPIVCSLHNVVRTALPLYLCDKLIVNSMFVKSTLIERHNVSPTKVEVVPIPLEEFTYNPKEKFKAKHEIGLKNQKIVLFVGRKCYEKGPQVLLNALPAVFRKFPDTIAIFIGPDFGFISKSTSFTDSLKRRAKQLGIEKNILFIGFRRGNILRRFFYAADVLVCPTIIEEAFGKVIIEAMATNTPVIGSNIGGIPELISHGKNGLLVPPNDSVSLSAALIHILGDNIYANILAKNGLDYVKDRFSFNSIGKRYIEIYETVLKQYT